MKTKDFVNIINLFLEETGIKHFCRKICKGRCCKKLGCQTCIEEDTPPPITCQAFICNSLFAFEKVEDIYNEHFYFGLLKYFRNMGDIIEEDLYFKNIYKNEKIQPIEIPDEFAKFFSDPTMIEMTKLSVRIVNIATSIYEFRTSEFFYLKRKLAHDIERRNIYGAIIRRNETNNKKLPAPRNHSN